MKNTENSISKTRTLKCFGLSAHEIAQKITDIYPLTEGISLRYQEVFPEIHIILQTDKRRSVLEDLESKIKSSLGDYFFGIDSETYASSISNSLRKNKFTLSVAESCTGGLISHLLTKEAGASDIFHLGMITYSNVAKQNALGVEASIIAKHGAVSEEVASAMAEKVRKIGKSTFGIAVSGIAGPTGGTPEKPVGTVYIATADKKTTNCNSFNLVYDRIKIQLLTSYLALSTLKRTIDGHSLARQRNVLQ
jgi:nicotinamide-nucleotide amidase